MKDARRSAMTAAMPLELQVYPTDAEAFDAAAALAAEHLRAAGTGSRAVALSGGRGGRAVMVALAARGDVPWDRIEWYWGDERVVAPDDPRSNVRLARESLLVPRGIAAARIHPPPLELGDAAAIAAAYAGTLAGLVFDLVFLGVGTNGHIASLMPGCAALGATAPVAPVPVEEVSEDPFVARVTITPPVLAAARRVIVATVGENKAARVAAAMRDPFDPRRVPAELVRPSERVTWVVDRAAAGDLLRDARRAD